MDSATAAVFYSETVLSLTPILIKSVPTTLSTQVLVRFLVYPLAALLVGGTTPLKHAYKSAPAAIKNLGLGSINLAHIASSYLAFQELPAGIAMSLFYTYPLWNLFGAALVYGEPFPWHLLPIVFVALFGTYLIITSERKPTDQDIGSEVTTNTPKSSLNWLGIGAALTAALTETCLFLAVKGTRGESPFFNIHQFYLGGLPLLAMALLSGLDLKNFGLGGALQWNWRKLLPLLAFNGILGFTGYTARFWAIPRLATIVYSVTSMFGVIASFAWGSFMLGERISGQALGGAGLLTAAIGVLRFLTA
jgi:drug/metabolite transporter (DMT)-like permease